MARSLAYEPRHALNAICPYFTMFPLEYPLRVLRRHRGDAGTVMDPFCGRGTSLYAARVLGLKARGIDSSKIAVAIAQAKLCNAKAEDALDAAREMLKGQRRVKVPETDFFRMAFNAATLADICTIRSALLRKKSLSGSEVLLRAAMLGCLHGPRTVSAENASYFSNQMPRTFSSKPDYSVRYWKRHRMAPPKAGVVEVLTKKLSRIDPPQASVGRSSLAKLGDSSKVASVPYSDRDFSVVVTSPPYYGMRTYVEDQWLRNWFLGGPDHVEYGTSSQLCHTGTAAFAESLGLVWKNMARTREEMLDMYIRFGVIPSSKVDPRKLIRESLESSGENWRIVHTRDADTASRGKRQATQMAAESEAAVEFDFHVVRA